MLRCPTLTDLVLRGKFVDLYVIVERPEHAAPV